MDLFENEELFKTKKKKFKIKPSAILITILIILLLLCFIIVGLIMHIKGTILTVVLDQTEANDLKSIFIIEEGNKIYIPIRKMAGYLQYETYNGDYITLSEDTNKCYIKNVEELVSFTLDSSIITKVTDIDIEEVKIDEPIKQINEELYITSEGAEVAFNIRFTFDEGKNQIRIETLPYLYQLYSQYAISLGYSNIENETFKNKTLIFNDLIIVKGTNNNYGVINGSGEVVLETKYEDIQYLTTTSEFLVSSNNKKGILSLDKSTKISVKYEDIQILKNKDKFFYLVKKSNKYGLLDSKGSVLIYPEYSGIGLNILDYTQNEVTSGYIIYDEIIPVLNNNKWALFNIKGEKITEFIYDEIGCKAKSSNTYGVLQIPEYNLIVVKQGEKYNIITLDGEGIFDEFLLDSVYITVNLGKTNYYMTYKEQKIELLNYLEKIGVKKAIN